MDVIPEIVFEAGKLKKKLGIALSDCYVIATAIKIQAKSSLPETGKRNV